MQIEDPLPPPHPAPPILICDAIKYLALFVDIIQGAGQRGV